LNKSEEILDKIKDGLNFMVLTETYPEKHFLFIFTYFLHTQAQLVFVALEIIILDTFGQNKLISTYKQVGLHKSSIYGVSDTCCMKTRNNGSKVLTISFKLQYIHLQK